MKKTTIVFCLLAIMVLLISGCSCKKDVPAPAPVEPEAPVVTEPVAPVEPTLPEPEVETEYAGESDEVVTEAVCSEGKIGARLTNTGDSAVTIGKEMRILLRGMVVKDPGCETVDLASGASTVCTQLNGPFPVVDGKNEVLIRIGSTEVKATVIC